MKIINGTALNLLVLAALISLITAGCKEDKPLTDKQDASGVAVESPAAEEKTASPLDKLPDVVARVNGTDIMKADLEKIYETITAQSMMLNEGKSEDEIVDFSLDELINAEVLKQETAKRDIRPSAEAVEKELESVKAQFPDAGEFEKVIAERGLTVEEIRRNITTQLAMQDILKKEIDDNISISESEIEKFYAENPSYFQTEESVKASHILVKSEEGADEAAVAEARKKVESILEEVRAGGDFAEIAKSSSEGPSGPAGGELGYFGRGQMVKPFEEAAFAMNVGDVSDVVRTQFGFHIIKVTDKKVGGTTPLNEVRATIEEYLKRIESGKRYAEYMEKLRSTSSVEKLI